MTGTPLLQAQGLVKRYGGVVATDQVTLRIDPGEVLGVIGPNGAGKSTLIGLLGGELAPSEGRIVYCGEDITRVGASERARRGIGRTYQIPRPFLDMTVRENLLAARHSVQAFEPARQAAQACDAILERCGLIDAAARPARELPLLRRKRLEVARALALGPKLLLLDEVGAGLVDAEVTELIGLIQSLRHEVQGLVIIEHVLRVVRECCERLMVINFGKTFAEGPTAQVMGSDEVAAIYLGTAHGKTATPAAAPAAPAKVARPVDVRAEPLLALQGVHAGYGLARVLDGVDLQVRAGEVVAVLGTNGAGKTTLARVISGSLVPTAGTLRVDGHDRTGQPPHVLSRLGLAQCMEGRRIFGTLTVEENLLLAARGVRDALRAERLQRVYALFPDLAQRRRNAGTSMSGGQQQMLAIGRALMAQPRLIVFDEISLGLAPIMMDRLYEALAALRAQGLTMLVVEQDVDRALDLADRVYVMEHGRIALSGTAQAVRNDPQLRHLYIGTAD